MNIIHLNNNFRPLYNIIYVNWHDFKSVELIQMQLFVMYTNCLFPPYSVSQVKIVSWQPPPPVQWLPCIA